MLGAAQRMGFQPARQAVAQAAFGGAAVVNCRILPEGPHFVDHRNTQPLADAQGRYRIEHWRMGVDDLRLHFDRHLKHPPFQLAHQSQFAQAGQARRESSRRRALKVPAVHSLFQGLAGDVLGAGEMHGFPAQLALLAQDGQCAEGVATVQRDRVVQHMQYAQAHALTASRRMAAPGSGVSSTTLRKKASNISSVHSGAL